MAASYMIADMIGHTVSAHDKKKNKQTELNNTWSDNVGLITGGIIAQAFFWSHVSFDKSHQQSTQGDNIYTHSIKPGKSYNQQTTYVMGS